MREEEVKIQGERKRHRGRMEMGQDRRSEGARWMSGQK